MSNDATPSFSSSIFRERALEAVDSELNEAAVRSAFVQNERFCLFSDSFEGNGKGIEMALEFVESPNSTGALSLPIDLASNGDAIFQGEWKVDVSVNGRKLEPVGNWETLCVDLDKAYAFCERSLLLEGVRRLSRRILLSYAEKILLLVDELLPSAADRANPVPRELNASFEVPSETAVQRDPCSPLLLFAVAKEICKTEQTSLPSASLPIVSRLFPLGLPSHDLDASALGNLEFNAETGKVAFRVVSQTSTLFCPLLFDFNRHRALRDASWTPLMVGENLKVADKKDAFGAKLRLGTEQYVLYASTSERPVLRSILGRHLLSDFLFGKFISTRGVFPLVEIELDEN